MKHSISVTYRWEGCERLDALQPPLTDKFGPRIKGPPPGIVAYEQDINQQTYLGGEGGVSEIRCDYSNGRKNLENIFKSKCRNSFLWHIGAGSESLKTLLFFRIVAHKWSLVHGGGVRNGECQWLENSRRDLDTTPPGSTQFRLGRGFHGFLYPQGRLARDVANQSLYCPWAWGGGTTRGVAAGAD